MLRFAQDLYILTSSCANLKLTIIILVVLRRFIYKAMIENDHFDVALRR
jgi:hypothetical protein